MQIDQQVWESSQTGTAMSILRFGTRGVPLLYLPTSSGDHTEFERYGMHQDCKPWIDAGGIQVFSVDAGGPESLFNESIVPSERIARYVQYENHIAQEVLPWIAARCDSVKPVVVGASYGAFVGANLLYRHPTAVGIVCGLGGVYGMGHCFDGYHDDAVYFHTPLEYLPRLEDATLLAKLRAARGLVMYAAEDDPWLPSSYQLARVLQKKKLPFEIDVWASPANHHEHWWKQQLVRFLARYPL